MDLLDGTIINIAGPSIRAELGGSTALLQWLAAGYTLAFAALIGATLVLPRGADGDRSLRLDLPGTALLSLALLLLVYPLVQGRELGWPWWAWAAMAVLGTAFFSWVRPGDFPSDFDAALTKVLWLELALLVLAGTLAFLLPRRAREETPQQGTQQETTHEPGRGGEPADTVGAPV